jgi:threonine/homoserine/homoserine lactone efflux protein
MEFAAFVASVVLISLSGVLAPGPILAATIAESRTNRYAGFHITMGHAMVEIPLIALLYIFGTMAESELLKGAIALIGGIVLLYLAYDESRQSERTEGTRRGMVTGIVLSALSPYFIIWWLTVGFTLILQATAFGVIGLITFVLVHEGCDAAWLGFVSLVTNKSSESIGPKAERALTAISVTILLVFGVFFIYMGAQALL